MRKLMTFLSFAIVVGAAYITYAGVWIDFMKWLESL